MRKGFPRRINENVQGKMQEFSDAVLGQFGGKIHAGVFIFAHETPQGESETVVLEHQNSLDILSDDHNMVRLIHGISDWAVRRNFNKEEGNDADRG